jgi:hypothetical protein
MVMEPQHYDPTALPAVADRRAPERRSYDRVAEERVLVARTAGAAAIAFCGGLFVVFVFFWALGAFSLTNTVAATLVAMVFALVWLGTYVYRRRQEEPPLIRRNRERRGF